MRITRIVAGSMIVLLPATLAAIPFLVDVENVPVERVIANLERQVNERPTDAGLRVNLAQGPRDGVCRKGDDDSVGDRSVGRANDDRALRGSARFPTSGSSR